MQTCKSSQSVIAINLESHTFRYLDRLGCLDFGSPLQENKLSCPKLSITDDIHIIWYPRVRTNNCQILGMMSGSGGDGEHVSLPRVAIYVADEAQTVTQTAVTKERKAESSGIIPSALAIYRRGVPPGSMEQPAQEVTTQPPSRTPEGDAVLCEFEHCRPFPGNPLMVTCNQCQTTLRKCNYRDHAAMCENLPKKDTAGWLVQRDGSRNKKLKLKLGDPRIAMSFEGRYKMYHDEKNAKAQAPEHNASDQGTFVSTCLRHSRHRAQ